jgi:hypothetical protein
VKYIAFRLLCLQLLAGLPGAVSVSAQGCSSWMTPAYSSYSSLTWSGTSFNSSVLVEGTTSGACPLGYSCSGVRHYPRANNQLGPVGGWSTGNLVPWNSYISYQDDQTWGDPVPGDVYDFESEGEIECTAVGLFASFPFPTPGFGFAITFTSSTTPYSNASGVCPQANACTNGTPACPVSGINRPPAGSMCWPYYESVIPFIGPLCVQVPWDVALADGPNTCTTYLGVN